MKQSPHPGAFRAPSSLPRDLCAGIAPLVPASAELTAASIPSSMLCPPLGMSFPLSTYLHPTHIFIHLFILPLSQKHLLSVSLVPEPRNHNLRTRKGLYVFTFLISLLSLLPNPPQIKKDRTTPGEPGPRGTVITHWLLAGWERETTTSFLAAAPAAPPLGMGGPGVRSAQCAALGQVLGPRKEVMPHCLPLSRGGQAGPREAHRCGGRGLEVPRAAAEMGSAVSQKSQRTSRVAWLGGERRQELNQQRLGS